MYKHKVVQAILNLSKNKVVHRKMAIVDSRFLTGTTGQLYFIVLGLFSEVDNGELIYESSK